MPNLTQKWKKQERISQLQVAYSILQNANKMAIAEHGDPSTWDYSGENRAKIYMEKYFIPYIKSNNQGKTLQELKDETNYYIYYVNGKQLVGRYTSETYNIFLENGMLVNSAAVPGIMFFVDLNGLKGPNILGNDIFIFNPPDLRSTTNMVRPLIGGNEKYCTPGYMTRPNRPTSYAGFSCAFEIIKNGWKIPDDYLIKKW